MIYYTFNDVKSEYDYIEKSKENAADYARKYINSVIREIGIVDLSQSMRKMCIVVNGESYRNYDVVASVVFEKGVRSINDMDIDTLYPICEAIRKLKLVAESEEEELEMNKEKEEQA